MSVSTPTIEPVAPPPVSVDSIPAARRYRLSVGQYLEMARVGILTKRDRVELLEGRLVTKMTKHPPHILATKQTIDALRVSVPLGWHVAQEAPIATLESVPEPNCTVIRGVAQDYRDRWPGPSDVALVGDYGPDDDVPLVLDGREVGRIGVRDLLP